MKSQTKIIEAKKLLAKLEETARKKPYREIFGVKVSENHGASWKIKALCVDCFVSLQPPVRAVKNGVAGVRFCDECGCKNLMYKS